MTDRERKAWAYGMLALLLVSVLLFLRAAGFDLCVWADWFTTI